MNVLRFAPPDGEPAIRMFAVNDPAIGAFKAVAARQDDGSWSCALTSHDFNPVKGTGRCVAATAATADLALDAARAKVMGPAH